MKNFIPLILLFLCSLAIGSETPEVKPMLRLHFDVNKNIIMTDDVQGKGLEETVNAVLAEFTSARWDGKSDQSYYAYITQKIAEENPQVPRASEEFKKKRAEVIKGFSNHIKDLPAIFAAYQQERAKLIALLSQAKRVIFPSFFKTIEWLNQNFTQRYALYLRTFGEDLPNVIPLIQEKSSIRFAAQGKFQGTELYINDARVSIPEFFSSTEHQHYALRDDYSYWKSKGFQAAGGKLFMVNNNEPKVVSIFFDDNANDPDKPIIHPVDLGFNLLDTQALLANGTIVATNPKEAALNEDYFIDKIKARLAK